MGYKFKGHDYEELARCWGIVNGVDSISAHIIHALEAGYSDEKALTGTANDIRGYCRAMARYNMPGQGVWKALSEEEDDWTVLAMFKTMLPIAWT